MTSLARPRTPSAQLLLRILDRPELVAAVRELPAPVLGSLIERVGLEDAGELVALASSEQLERMLDQDVWRAAAPGEDEQFRPERFALWLEIMAEGGEDFLVERLCGLPRDLLALAVQRLVLVVDMDALGEELMRHSDEQQRLEQALDAPLSEDWEEFRVLSRDPLHWDAVWGALVALDRDHHELVRAIVEQCCAASAEYAEERGGLYEVLTSAQMLEGDAAAEREDRRAAEGFVAPADARSFLALARRGDASDSRDPITKAYFRALAADRRPAPAAGPAPAGRGAEPTAPASDVRELVHLLEGAAVIERARGPIAALAAGTASAEESMPLLKQALIELRQRAPDVFSRRVEELGYLANVLVAGSSGRRPRPVEALEQAIAACDAGLEGVLGADRTLARAVAVLAATPADLLFRRGYR